MSVDHSAYLRFGIGIVMPEDEEHRDRFEKYMDEQYFSEEGVYLDDEIYDRSTEADGVLYLKDRNFRVTSFNYDFVNLEEAEAQVSEEEKSLLLDIAFKQDVEVVVPPQWFFYGNWSH